MQDRRRAAYAGTFYPSSREELRGMFEAWAPERTPIADLVGLILPHAGYQYSGAVAAAGYRSIPEGTKRVILAGPSHHYPASGIVIWDGGPWETPLGDVPPDRDLVESLLRTGVFSPDPRPFLPEHSLEVHMPFIKHFLPDSSVVPMIAGGLESHYLEEAAEALRGFIGKDTVIIASSDLYHGYSYEECVAQDKETLSWIRRINGKEFLLSARQRRVMACGDNAIALLLETVSRLSGPRSELLLYTNSAEVTGAYAGYVVGYAAVAFTAR
jgi:AmmeMemoRadiSam system protein B